MKTLGSISISLLVLSLLGGVFAGGGTFTFVYAKGHSYLSNDPKSCVNCHIMREQFDSWMASTHRRVATCNDCHTPHTLPGKYLVKAENGFWHSYKFTFQNWDEPIRIREKNRRVLQENCLYCHDDLVSGIAAHGGGDRSAITCVQCHSGVGHALK